MEVDEIQTPQQACKYSRVSSKGTRIDSSQIGVGGGGGSGGPSSIIRDDDDKSDVVRRAGPIIATTTTPTLAAAALNGVSSGGGEVVGSTRYGRQWQHSSRIIRVSRASGGKDRHSKVWTAKGPRDRRVRLSVSTAIQFYDLQDRLGYDQPSKAVEWLIKAAADSINELPSLNSSAFPPETPRQLNDERRPGNAGDAEMDGDPNFGQDTQLQQLNSMSMSKSGCSSNNSEGSKGSGLSLSRSEIRVKARERARERTAKDKEKESDQPSRVNVAAHHHNHHHQQQHNVTSMSQTSSFTQLLTAGINNLNESNAAGSSSPSPHLGCARGSGSTGNLQWLSSSCTTPMAADYFGTGLMGSRTNHSVHQLGNTSFPHVMTLSSFNLGGSENSHQHHHQQQHHSHELQLHNHHSHHQQQHFPFLSDQHHLLQQVPNAGAGAGAGASGSDYNLNFSISSSSTTSGLTAGFNRGTLQSNSPSLLNYLQRFSTADGTSVPFFLGGAAISSSSPAVENQDHHHDHQQFHPSGLQLCYGDEARHSDQKGKAKH